MRDHEITNPNEIHNGHPKLVVTLKISLGIIPDELDTILKKLIIVRLKDLKEVQMENVM